MRYPELAPQIAARLRSLLAQLASAKPKVSARELSRRAGLAEGHVSNAVKWLEEGRDTYLGTLVAIANAAGVSPAWLVMGMDPQVGLGVRLRDLPAWPEAERVARARYGGDVPDFAITEVGNFILPHPPDLLDGSVVGAFARAWLEASSEKARAAAEKDHVRAQVAARRETGKDRAKK